MPIWSVQVLQRQIEMELDLLGECKEPKGHSIIIGRVSVSALTSQPVDHEENSKSSGKLYTVLSPAVWWN